MGKQEIRANLVRVKLALAEKYERRARVCNSRPTKKTLLRHADSYRRQASQLTLQ